MEPVCRRGCAGEEINHLAKSHRASDKRQMQTECGHTTGHFRLTCVAKSKHASNCYCSRSNEAEKRCCEPPLRQLLIQPRSVACTRRGNKSYRTQDRGSTELLDCGDGAANSKPLQRDLADLVLDRPSALRMNVIQVLLPTIAVSWQHDWRKIAITESAGIKPA
jgi:hypothetical protein